ncbi:MAG: DUF2892 domain-containing protein [Anaerolineae bacterium]|nr:DUF2892 domain-containing protein [Anaerolineae bacterium]
MVKNMGKIDRIIRIVVAAVFIIFIAAGVVSGWLAIVLGVLALVFVVTSYLAFCPLYVPFKISTRKEGER